MTDEHKTDEDFDIFVANAIYPEASFIFTRLQSLEEIKDDCYIVLDTNVLLALYTIGKEDLFDQCRRTYSSLKKRLIIPGQVAREFAKNRTAKLSELHFQIGKKQLPSVQKGKYPLLSPLTPYKNLVRLEGEIDRKLKEYEQEYKKTLQEVLKNIEGWRWNDPVSVLYNELFDEDTIVDTHINEEEVEKELEKRKLYKHLPGYKDAGKEDKGIGDLLIWRTILEIGESHQKSVIFVSGDGKPDWCQKSNGQPLYPKYELVYNFKRKSGGQSFHILKLSAFLELFGASEKVVEEVREEEVLLANKSSFEYHELAHLAFGAEEAVHKWLKHIYPKFAQTRGRLFNLIIERQDGRCFGVEVKYRQAHIDIHDIHDILASYPLFDNSFDELSISYLILFIVHNNEQDAVKTVTQLQKLPKHSKIIIAIGYLNNNGIYRPAGSIPFDYFDLGG